MWMLVSLTKVKAALRIDHTDDDSLLELYISAASRAVHAYIGDQAGELLSMDSPPDSPANDLDDVDERVQAAIIFLTGHWYRAPDQNPDGVFKQGYLPEVVTSLLYALRDPALA